MLTEIETIQLPSGVSFDLVYIDDGEFMMGGDRSADEKPSHTVRISSFYIGRFPVTQKLYEQVRGENPSLFKGENRPVERVSWDDAQECIKILNNQTGRTFRLPTEAEWEFAARGGMRSNGFTYSGSERLEEVGWFGGNSYGETKPVGLKLPNELGLHDMSGNLWEWCQDLYDKEYYQQCVDFGVVLNPQGPDSGSYRVLRGGSYFNHPEDCRSAFRLFYHPVYRNDILGFRLVAPCQSVG